jgi:hypothetical protein
MMTAPFVQTFAFFSPELIEHVSSWIPSPYKTTVIKHEKISDYSAIGSTL